MAPSEQIVALLRGLSTRDVAIASGLVAAAIWIGGFASGSGWTLSLDADLGIPALFIGAMVVLSAWLLVEASRAPSIRGAQRRAWRALALALFVVGGEQALSLHQRFGEGLGLSPAAAVAPLLALLAIAVVLALKAPANPGRSWLIAGIVVLAAADALAAVGDRGGAVAGLLALASAPMMLVGALGMAQRCYPAPPGRVPPLASASLRDLLLRVDVTRLAAVAVVALGAVLGAGVLFHAGILPATTLDLRSQQGANTLYSIALLVVAGGLALLCGRLSDDPWYAWTLLGLAFWAMAINDSVGGHELIGEETGIKGQILLLPVVVAAGVGWLYCFRLGPRSASGLLVGGAVAWAVSQLIDLTGPEGEFQWWVLPEEALELIGTTMFVLALVVAVQATRRNAVDRRGQTDRRDGSRSYEAAAVIDRG